MFNIFLFSFQASLAESFPTFFILNRLPSLVMPWVHLVIGWNTVVITATTLLKPMTCYSSPTLSPSSAELMASGSPTHFPNAFVRFYTWIRLYRLRQVNQAWCKAHRTHYDESAVRPSECCCQELAKNQKEERQPIFPFRICNQVDQ